MLPVTSRHDIERNRNNGRADDEQDDEQLRQRFEESSFSPVGHYNSENAPRMFPDFSHGLTLKVLANSDCWPVIFFATCMAETMTGVMPPPGCVQWPTKYKFFNIPFSAGRLSPSGSGDISQPSIAPL